MILYIFPKNPPSGDIWHMHNRTRSRSLSKLHDGRKTLDWPAVQWFHAYPPVDRVVMIYIYMPARWLALGHQVVDRLLQTVRYSTVRQLICWLVCSFFFNVPTPTRNHAINTWRLLHDHECISSPSSYSSSPWVPLPVRLIDVPLTIMTLFFHCRIYHTTSVLKYICRLEQPS